jgi:hypothetical protein
MALESLPPEILHQIFSDTAINHEDLRNFTLVSHNLWDVATSIWYANLDLKVRAAWRGGVFNVQKDKEKLVGIIASYVESPLYIDSRH